MVGRFWFPSQNDVFQKKRVSPPASLIYAFRKEISGHELRTFFVGEPGVRGSAAVMPSVQNIVFSVHHAAAFFAFERDAVNPRFMQLEIFRNLLQSALNELLFAGYYPLVSAFF